MDSGGTGNGRWTRGKKRIADEEETREEEKKQMKKRQHELFGPRFIPSSSNSSGPRCQSLLIGPKDIVVNPNIQKIQLPENPDVKPEVKEEEIETTAAFQNLTVAKNEIDLEDEVDSTDQVAIEESALQLPENFEVRAEIKEEGIEVEHSTIVVVQDNCFQNPVPVTNEIDLEDDVGVVGVEESEEIIVQLGGDSNQVEVEHLRCADFEEKMKEKDLRIRELELQLEFEKQSNQQLSNSLANAKGTGTSDENGVENATTEDSFNRMIGEILNGNSREKVESLVKMVEDWKAEQYELNTTLHIAARAGNLKLLLFAISLSRGVNSRNVHGSTPLMEAARGNQNFLEVADLLIRSGADLRATNNSGENALFIAVEAGKTLEEIRKLCFENCLEVKCSRRGDTVLHKAAMSGNLEALEHFVSLKPDVNVKNDKGWTPLMTAAFAEQNFSPIMDLLLRNGADASSVDNRGVGVLVYAISSRKYQKPMSDLIKLIDAGAEWDKNSILHLCINMGHNEGVKYFAANGASLENFVFLPIWSRVIPRPKTNRPLSLAAVIGNIEAMVSLLDNGATNFNGYKDLQNDRFLSRATAEVLDKLSKVRDIWDDSIFHGFAKNGNLEGVRWCVLKKGADVNLKDPKGETPLFVAATAEKPKLELLDYLVENGANIDEVNMAGFSSLHNAAERGRSLEVLETLINRYGATWSTGVVGNGLRKESILHGAIRGGLPEVVEYFVARGIELNCVDSNGDTPFLHAVKFAKKNSPEIWRVLMNGGADPNAKDKDGNSALLLGVRQVEHGNTLLTLDQLKVLVTLGCDWRAPNMEGLSVLSKLEGDGNSEALEFFKSLA